MNALLLIDTAGRERIRTVIEHAKRFPLPASHSAIMPAEQYVELGDYKMHYVHVTNGENLYRVLVLDKPSTPGLPPQAIAVQILKAFEFPLAEAVMVSPACADCGLPFTITQLIGPDPMASAGAEPWNKPS